MKVLVLTKNILTEKEFQSSLQELNYEVFSTRIMLDQILNRAAAESGISMFDVVVLSESITNEEATEIIPVVKKTNRLLLRKTDDIIDKEERKQSMQFDGLIHTKDSKEGLRELFGDLRKQLCKSATNSTDSKKKYTEDELDTLKGSLSIKERQVFEILIESKGRCIKKEQLYSALWESYSTPTNSNVSNLAGLIKKIREKITKNGMEGIQIITERGRGYKLAC